MRLAPRLVLAFGFLAAVSTAGLGLLVREDRGTAETARFEAEVGRACENVKSELRRQAERDTKLIGGACQAGELVDRALVSLEAGDFSERRLGFSSLVPQERVAFDLDELLLAVGGGDIVGADPRSLLALTRREVGEVMGAHSPPDPKTKTAPAASEPPASFTLRMTGTPAIVSRCTRAGRGHHVAGLVGARHLAPVLERLGSTLGVGVATSAPVPSPGTAHASCVFQDGEGQRLPITVTKPKTELDLALAQLDQRIFFASLSAMGMALVFAVLLARSLGRPLSELAREASKVATDEARPLRVRGSGEIHDLVLAFDKMIEDLAVTKRRLAATSRVAAWREVARRVAHEVKNPLAPIRAAVETLRRLRAREDPAFDDYFDEATRTVLTEVHRISNIVTEFTRFARLPPPRPEEVDPVLIARHVIQAHEPLAEGIALSYVVVSSPPPIRADRDQIVQVLTNLVQNALDAVKGRPRPEVVLSIDADPQGSHVSFTVKDNGAGIAKEIAARLFEPYATTKAQGTGLGLAIAQRIAIEHNGELSYLGTSPEGGAVFRLTLPVEGPPPVSDGPPLA